MYNLAQTNIPIFRNIMKKFYPLYLLFFLIISELGYSQQATLKGKIIEPESKEAVPFANVVPKGSRSGAASNIDGMYSLKLDPGTYTIVITAVGYSTKEEKVTLTAGETKVLNINLPKSAVALDMFVKTEGKFEKKIEELTVSLDVIKPNIIENKNVTSADQALQQTPGLVIVDSEPQLRGGSGYSFGAGSRVMVLVDDLPLLSGDAGRPSWGFIPVENIEQIEVVKGASSVLYGSAALSGVINIRSAYPKDKPKTRINVFGGIFEIPKANRWYSNNGKLFTKDMPFNTGISFLHAQKFGKKKQLDLTVGGNFYWESGATGPTSDTSRTVDDVREYEKRGRVNFNLRYRNQKIEGLSYGINGNFMYSTSAGAFIWQNDQADIFRSMKGTVTKTLQTTFHIDPFISYQMKNGTTHNLRARYFYLDNNNNNNQGNSSQYIYAEYQTRIVVPKVKDFFITPGVMTSYTMGQAQLFAGSPPIIPAPYDSLRKDKISTDAINAAVYVQIEKKLWKRLTLAGGARLEYFRIGKYDRYTFLQKSNLNNTMPYDTNIIAQSVQPVFRVGANVKCAEETYLRASFGQGFRFPTIAERFIQTRVGPASIYPNPDLKPEKSYSVELGFKQGLKAGQFVGYLDVAGFYQRFRDAVEFTFATWSKDNSPENLYGLGFKSVNIGRTQVWGVDVSLLGQGKITKNFGMNFLIGYTYTDPTSLDPTYQYTKDLNGNGISNQSTSIDYKGPDADKVAAMTDSKGGTLLKYRIQHLVRADVEFNYKKLSFGVSARYSSFMRNIDVAFKLIEDLNIINGLTSYRNRRRNGDLVLDARVSYEVYKGNKISLICNNVTNRVYALRPLSLENPRQWMLQYTVTF